MKITLKNNTELNLQNIKGVQVRKVLTIGQNGHLGVSGWNVLAIMHDGSRPLIARRGPGEEREAYALCSMINHMTIFTTKN